jgi:hypothetical protein
MTFSRRPGELNPERTPTRESRVTVMLDACVSLR